LLSVLFIIRTGIPSAAIFCFCILYVCVLTERGGGHSFFFGTQKSTKNYGIAKLHVSLQTHKPATAVPKSYIHICGMVEQFSVVSFLYVEVCVLSDCMGGLGEIKRNITRSPSFRSHFLEFIYLGVCACKRWW
jgi:hypothetical protein